jgi:hypothetical protein
MTWGGFEATKSEGYGNFPNALLPAERRGRRIFGRFWLRASVVMWNSELGLGFGGESPRGLAFCFWGFGPLLFDNRIGRKRDVGGGVLAGPWSSGLIVSASLGIRSGDQRPKETTDGHVSTIHRASNEARETVVRRAAWVLFRGGCVGTRQDTMFARTLK